MLTNVLLETIVSQLRASAAGSALNSTLLDSPFTPSQPAVRLNVLWFSSLVCSLLAALGAVFAKQWIVQYPRGAAPSATPCERAQHRQIRFTGLTTWHFLAVVDFLPSLIQLAFILFFLGLCDFLMSQNTLVGSVVTILCVIGLLFTIFCHIAAIVYPSCPFRTPLSTSIIHVCRVIADNTTKMVLGPVEERYNLWYHPTGWRSIFIRGWKTLRYDHPERVGDIPRWARSTASLAEDERLTIVNAQALAWLLHCVSDEDQVVTISSFIPGLPVSDLRVPLTNALPRLCTLFQSYFVIDGDFNSFCPKIVPREQQHEKIKTLGRAIHLIMLAYPFTSYGGRATRVIGDIFGDAYLVFPPRGIDPDTHALVCSLLIADRSYHRRYGQAVQEQLLLSLLRSHTIAPWSLLMVLDSLCLYISTKPQHSHLSPHFRTSSLSHLTHILRQGHRMAELPSAVGRTMNLILGGFLLPKDILRDKAEFLPQNLYAAISAVISECRTSSLNQTNPGLHESCLVALLHVFRDFANFGELRAPFLTIRREVLATLCHFLLQDNSWSAAAIDGAISVIDCYPEDVLPLTGGPRDVHILLSQVMRQIHPDSADNDVKSMLHLISRLIDIGIEASLSPFVTNIGDVGVTLVNFLKRTGCDETKSAVLHSLARHAGFWFHETELLHSLQTAGISATILDLLSNPIAESDLLLVLVIVDHLVIASPLPFIEADPDLQAFDFILRRHDLDSYTQQRCATVMLRLLQHLSGEDKERVLGKSHIIDFVTQTLAASHQVERYVIEEWLELGRTIAATHRAKLSESGFLDALRSAASAHGIVTSVDWFSTLDQTR